LTARSSSASGATGVRRVGPRADDAPLAATGCGAGTRPSVYRPGTPYAAPPTTCCGVSRETWRGSRPAPPPAPYQEASRHVKVPAEKKGSAHARLTNGG